ncbi:MAG: hypothetical protein KJZ87_25115 [Thermoguttaceae bacterium]|nr:hypothetical protein [Thermoguttaceae bacterium]
MHLPDWRDYQAIVLDGILGGAADARRRRLLAHAADSISQRAKLPPSTDDVLAAPAVAGFPARPPQCGQQNPGVPLDPAATVVDNDSMTTRMSIAESLRAAIAGGGLTVYRISVDTGIPYHNLRRFIRRDTDLRLDHADRLAAYFGLWLTVDPDAVPPSPTPANRARPMLAKRPPQRRRSAKKAK